MPLCGLTKATTIVLSELDYIFSFKQRQLLLRLDVWCVWSVHLYKHKRFILPHLSTGRVPLSTTCHCFICYMLQQIIYVFTYDKQFMWFFSASCPFVFMSWCHQNICHVLRKPTVIVLVWYLRGVTWGSPQFDVPWRESQKSHRPALLSTDQLIGLHTPGITRGSTCKAQHRAVKPLKEAVKVDYPLTVQLRSPCGWSINDSYNSCDQNNENSHK